MAAPPANTELELKFTIAESLAPALLPWLRMYCRPHSEYPEAWISSVYYDTPDWQSLNEKVNSDYYKRKVRLRWYRAPGGSELSQVAFIEQKQKAGSIREKVRAELSRPASFWAAEPLESPAFTGALAGLTEQGVADLTRVRPAFQIGYHRRRFVHSFSTAILCLDTNIRVERVNGGRFTRGHPSPLAQAVLEQKSPLDRLDPVFDGLERFGLRRTAFSKYQSCFLHLTNDFL